MMHVQHLLGVGHQHRAAALCRALQDERAQVLYVTGGMPVPGLDLGSAHLAQLPAARAADAHYTGLVDADGRMVSEGWRAARRERLLALLACYRPDVLVVETFPFGRKLLSFELLPLLEAAHRARPRPRVVCSVRDILEPRSRASRYRDMLELARRYFDRILVHSDPDVIPFSATFPHARALEPWLVHTGFVVEPPPRTGQRASVGRGEVIVSAGGGAVGRRLITQALAARRMGAAAGLWPGSDGAGGRSAWGHTWRILTGIGTGLRARSRSFAGDEPGLVREPNREDFPALLRRCRVSVSQGGYNTVLEIVRARCRSVIVPYADAGQREQGIRARLFRERGLVRVVDEATLSPARLARAVRASAVAPRPPGGAVDMGGAQRAAELIAALGGGPAR